MLKSFQCKDTKALCNDLPVARFKTINDRRAVSLSTFTGPAAYRI
jgi:hypothetical protein